MSILQHFYKKQYLKLSTLKGKKIFVENIRILPAKKFSVSFVCFILWFYSY